ncbi:hypothetical protein [Actinoplanes flavus]|uniref:Uncharacterized protein n=1 Tax=Actinoplanes flavus TaxID=2820290 RepID=A0ABS3UIS4_9ACTN|nr:hypothetical protein [Actinoplanes flavus]MBO3738665.1 hypothetical protein [Actinoplanes flavus]
MGWTELLPEPGDEPADLVAPPRRRVANGFTRDTPLPDPATVGVADAVEAAETALAYRSPEAKRAIRAWPAGLRRQMVMWMHRKAVTEWWKYAPSDGPVRDIPALTDGISWTRSELAWALRTADGYGQFDGAGFILPGLIATSLTDAELDGFGPVLEAVFDAFITEQSTPSRVRAKLGELYGTAFARATGELPLDLLPWHDPFGELASESLPEMSEPGVERALRHALSLKSVIPSKAWLSRATVAPIVPAVLTCFSGYRGRVTAGTDQLLRGLAWTLSRDPSDEATALLCQVAITAGSSGPRAPQTTAAAVEILATRSGPGPTRALGELSGIVTKTVLARVKVAMSRLPAS